MFDAMEGYAAAREGTIYHTSNGGETWEFHAPTFAYLSNMDFPPGSDTGYTCGMNSAMFRITPQGVEQMVTGTVSNLDAIHFLDRNHGWSCGESILLEYVNGTWIGEHAYPSGFWYDVFFIDSLNGWGAGYWLTGGGTTVDTAVIIHTTDDSSWFTPQLINVGNTGSFVKVFFLNNQMGWTINASGRIYSTTDGGNTWTREAEGMTEEFLICIQFTSSNNGYVAGNNKTLLKYTLLSDVEEWVAQPREFKLEQNYPNPFNPSTTIRFTIPLDERRETGNVTLKVYDVLGNEIATLVDEEKSPGRYEVEFLGHSDGGLNLSSGVYFYQLSIIGPETSSGQVLIQTKKMIIMK
jgi:photosystem II stability/assembly factor-like uncharacterized protein